MGGAFTVRLTRTSFSLSPRHLEMMVDAWMLLREENMGGSMRRYDKV